MKRSDRKLVNRRVAFFGEFVAWPSFHGGTPEQVARRHGATVTETVDEHLHVLVIADGRGPGRADARNKAERINARATKAGAPAPIRLLDEAGFRDLVREDLTGKRFAFAGGFDFCNGFDATLLHRMVETAGGAVADPVDADTDYFVLGERRVAGKAAVQKQVDALVAAGAGIVTIGERGFLELVRAEAPAGAMDFTGLYANLASTTDPGKLQRALKMLKAESFRLYSRVEEDGVIGVVRSQTSPGGVYAPWLSASGKYGCCNPELEPCLGLNGSPCKHLLVLVIGLAHAGALAPARAHAWFRASSGKGPSRVMDRAAEAFIQYKGAEAGELDWRPTETVPEDFYAF